MDSTNDETVLIDEASVLLGDLVSQDDWLPVVYATPDPLRYQQSLLHCDSRERFSVVSFVWGPGQSTPIHDHRVWGLVGMLRGAELDGRFDRNADGGLVLAGAPTLLKPGDVAAVSSHAGDVHRVANAYEDRPSISIHVYGANIGAIERSTYDIVGRPKKLVSGYAKQAIPNIWDRSSGV